MTQSNLLQLAKSGDAEAIAALMNSALLAIGVSARAAVKDGSLYILLESDRELAKSPAVEFIRRGITRLGVAWFSSAVVCSRIVGQTQPLWVQRIDLSSALASNPFVLDPGVKIEAEAGLGSLVPVRRGRVSLFHLLMLSVPVLLLFGIGHIWHRYFFPTSQSASVELAAPNSKAELSGAEAEGKSKNPLEQAKVRAATAVELGIKADSADDWQKAAEQWRLAIALLEQVPPDGPNAAIAAQKISEYQGHLNFVIKDKLGSPAGLTPVRTISGNLSPKSVVHSGKDLFFAQNMMYQHSINVYNRRYELVKSISDQVKLADYGYSQYQGSQQGAPVEAAFSPDGDVGWVSNYQMYGAGFSSTADDDCSPAGNHDQSFLYRINTQSLTIEKAVQVGAVPKFLATTPNGRYVLASNWCSWDVSVVDTQQNKEVRRIQIGPYPRGIVVDAKSETAYIAVMGSYDIAKVNLNDFSVDWLRGVGHSPRHLNLDPNGKYLYATLNGEGQVAKIDVKTGAVVAKVSTGNAPRSMVLSSDGLFLYVVNYNSDTVSKVRTADMAVVHSVSVNPAPIGITYDAKTRQVWVACYSGSIQVFQD